MVCISRQAKSVSNFDSSYQAGQPVITALSTQALPTPLGQKITGRAKVWALVNLLDELSRVWGKTKALWLLAKLALPAQPIGNNRHRYPGQVQVIDTGYIEAW